ncbi:MAG: hypothetical protein M1839_007833 [Geoglossum umbratile]|nr:MAG: hypothetical protein M1839_007833 [Geoglossum umbratile]
MIHRLRTRKKAKEASLAPRRPSDESEVPSLPPAGGRSFKWSKGQQVQSKPDFDLAHALPPTDDFRTSLLMPKMSARFSMLREQDDPNTKIGKANDDSVLAPRRSSRYGEFGVSSPGPWSPGGGLSDIMEVSSIKGSVRPPFANSNGSSEDIGTDDESSQSGGVMARSRGGDGNNLFGGRQKVYKIPTGTSSSKNLSSAGGDQDSSRGMGGKFLYENDVAMSSFQRLRETEREREKEMDQKGEAELQQSQQLDRANSPPLSDYNRNRETSSSTTSGPPNTRISTAATSINSQNTPSIYGGNGQAWASPPALPSSGSSVQGSPAAERSNTKSRRPLYEQGLDQHLHEQQSHAINKLDILSRQRTVNGGTPHGQFPSLNHASSALNLKERHDQPISPIPRSDGARARVPSPPLASPPALGAFNFGLSESSTEISGSDKSSSEKSSPLMASSRGPRSKPLNVGSNGASDPWASTPGQSDDGGVAAVVFGAFARQKKQYDEQQYSQRQLQMQIEREAQLPPRSPPPQTPAPNPPVTARARMDANAAYRSRSRSNSSTQKQYVQPAESAPRKPDQMPFDMNRPRANANDASQPNGTYTFLDISSPEQEDDPTFIPRPKPSRRPDGRYNQHFPPQVQRPPVDERPANLRIPEPQSGPIQEVTHADRVSSPSGPREHRGVLPENVKSNDEESNDSPTLGPDGGLSLLVRRHLRSDSGRSSVYGGGLSSYYGASTGSVNGTSGSRSGPAAGIGRDMSTRESRTTEQSVDSSSGNPFEFEDWEGGYFGEAESNSSTSPIGPGLINGSAPPPLAVSSKLHQDQRKARNNDEPLKGESAAESGASVHHTSKASTDTQREREDFANELAQRRKKIQDNLRSYAEKDGRSMSPTPGNSTNAPVMEYIRESPIRAGSPFGILGPKSTRMPEGPLKAKKLLGLGVNNVNSSPRVEDDYWKREEERMLHDVVRAPKIPTQQTHQTKAASESTQPLSPSWVDRQGLTAREEVRHDEDDPDSKNKPTPRPSRPPSLSPSSGRERSGSDNSMRGARNKDVKYRDDLQRAMAKGIGSSTSLPEDQPISRKYSDPSRKTPELLPQGYRPGSGQVTSAPGRSRSNSKSAFPGAFDSNDLLAFQTTGMPPRPSPSPITPFSANSTPSLYESPVTSATATPTKATGPGFQSSGRIPASRKKSINKADISEPIFLSATSTITTVNLPPGASLKNGCETPPPVPPLNPRRRRLTTTQTVFGAFSRSEKNDPPPPMPIAEVPPPEERSTFSADEESSRPKFRTKLRKSSSEGGNLNARARQQAMMAPSPAMPAYPTSTPIASPITPVYPHSPNAIPPQRVVEGGMF